MGRPREPIELIISKNKKHLTKDEIAKRRASEVEHFTDEIRAPEYLTCKQKKQFNLLASQLQKINIMGETDSEALARYVTAQSLYEETTKELRNLRKEKPQKNEAPDMTTYYARMESWMKACETAAKLQDRYFKQAQTAAAALGLTISSRCKLVAPAKQDEPKPNKFAQFGAG